MSGERPSDQQSLQRARARFAVRGAVQGVGFRPFVYRLAVGLGLAGWVTNNSQGVAIEVEGGQETLELFHRRLLAEKPDRSFIQSCEVSYLDPAGFTQFEIKPSTETGAITALVLPDIATCPDCLRELFDPADRRYRYPFINCTHCGPRFSIIEALPYDRPMTTMKQFVMCPACAGEYDSPFDRRFHAQPNACPACGPRLAFIDAGGKQLAAHDEALAHAVDAIINGKILALKGLGGFHLITDARNEEAIRRLRERKHREEKPFALMFPSLEAVRTHCRVGPVEEQILCSPESPIVLLERRAENAASSLAPSVAPGNPALGVMLPYTPLHHLLMHDLGFPVVATSGNRADEPICTDEQEALARLHGIADCYLVHNRPIKRHVDDSIVRLIAGRPVVMRRARGYAPLPLTLTENLPPLLAVGAHLKNTVAVTAGPHIILSQHCGDLETAEANEAFRNVIGSLQALYGVQPRTAACDLHPDYISSQYAQAMDVPLAAVQHHAAHVYACMAENELSDDVLGVSWDGTGLGTDGTIWGGEFLHVKGAGFTREAAFRTFKLPGGDSAIKEPRRIALGLLYELLGENAADLAHLPPLQAFSRTDLAVLMQMLSKGVNAPATSSAGRLFDAVASLFGLRQVARYEGQAAMELEYAARTAPAADPLPYAISERHVPASAAEHTSRRIIDWGPMFEEVLAPGGTGTSVDIAARRFHETLAVIIVDIARRTGCERVALTGGCFQNSLLTELATQYLTDAGFRVYRHQRFPPNDGGIALGQAYAVIRRRRIQHEGHA